MRVALFYSIAGLPTRQRQARKIELKARRAYLNKRCADEPESFVPERRTLMKPEASHKEVVLVSDAAQRKPQVSLDIDPVYPLARLSLRTLTAPPGA